MQGALDGGGRETLQRGYARSLDPLADTSAPGGYRTPPFRVLRHHTSLAVGHADLVEDVGHVRAERREPPIAVGRLGTIGTDQRVIPVYDRAMLGAGVRLNGPLIVVELSATAYVAPEFALRCDDYGNLHLELRTLVEHSARNEHGGRTSPRVAARIRSLRAASK